MKRSISICLILVLLLVCLPLAALAADNNGSQSRAQPLPNGTLGCSGEFGNGFKWTLNRSNVLTITGQGDLPAYTDPWRSYRNYIDSVVISEGITGIGSSVLSTLPYLTKVTFPDSLTYIGDHQFSGSETLTTVNFGRNLTSIGEWAFKNCDALTSITLPNSLTELGASAFEGCNGLTSVKIGNGLTAIPRYAFKDCSGLKTLTLGSGIQTIEYYAFSGCSSLSALNLPASLTTLESSAFAGCNSLRTVTIPNTVTSISNAFNGCTGLTSISIGSGVTEIANTAFKNCSKLQTVTMSDNVISIGKEAFYECTSLTSINLSKNISTLGASAFSGCTSLRSITLPDGLTELPSGLFYECRSLSKVVVPSSVTQIHYTTFEYCNSLLTAGPIDGGYSYEFEWTEKIPSAAFSGCYKMKSIVLPETITEIGSSACRGLYNLDSINLPEGLIRIGAYGLASSESVNELVLPKSLKELGSDPFSYCSSSTVITFQSTPALDDGFCVNHDITIRYPAGMGWNDEYKAYFDGFGTINWICYCMDGQHTVKAYTSNQDATCSADGTETGICIDCGESVTRVQTDTQLKHSYKNAFCIHCGHELDWINAPVISLTACADSSIDISWGTVDHAANYRIFRESADSDSAKLLAKISDTTYSDTDTFPGTIYTYYVQAVAANDVVSEKSSASVTALLPPPTVKAGNDATSGAIQLTWNAPTGAVCYEVYRAKSNGVYELLKTTTKTSLTDLGTVVGNTYSYKVTAVTKTGIASVSSKAVTGICLLPTTTLTASNIASTGKIQLKWNAVEGAESYKIYYATSKTATYKLLISTTSTSIKHTSAVAGQTYYYKVVAVAKNTKANSTSAVKSRTCDLVPPKVTISNDTATGKNLLKWGAVKNAVSYKIYRATSKTGKYSLQNTVTSTSYLDNSATTGKSYYYKVLAVASNTNANSDYSNVVNRLCDCAQPTVKVAASSTSYIKLSWNKVTGAKKYQVYQATSKTGTYKLIKTTTDTSLKISSVTAGKTYYYKVRAVASNTNANSAFSQILTAKATVAAPKLSSSVTATSSSIKISWEKVSNATGYYIYRRSSTSNSWTKIKTITSGSTTSFTNSVSGRYYYCVAAYKTVGRNTYTGFKSDAIRARTLAAPSTVSATAVNDTLNNTISWSKVTGATGYQLYRKTGDNGSWKLITTLGSSTTSYTHQNVTKGVYYYYRVRAIYKTNGVTSYGPFKASGSKVIHSDPPKAMATMTATTALNTRSVAVFLYNQGDSPLKVYCNTGRWLATNSTLNRDITVSAFATEGITVTSKYITIAPGKGTSLIITAKSSTNYNKYTKICMLMNYEGVDYTTYCSSTGGFSLTYLS